MITVLINYCKSWALACFVIINKLYRLIVTVELPGTVRPSGAKNHAQGSLFDGHWTNATRNNSTARLLRAMRKWTSKEHYTAK